MRHCLVVTALLALACGGSDTLEDRAALASVASAPTGSPAAPDAARAVHTVDMVLTNDGKYAFQPARLTIKVGDTVRWVNVSGGPHNVQFYGDQIPDGASEALNATMPDRMGNLSGRLLVAPDDTYEIVFANAPAGTYGYTCTPHELLGMSATLTIED